MGFASGFTGGVALTLSVAYLSAVAHRRNREYQADVLRSQALALHGLIDPPPAPLPPRRSEVAAAQRETTIEVVKDRWNQEVLSATRWAQRTDWDEVREDIEDGAVSLWAKIFGESPAQSAETAKERLEPVAQRARTRVEETKSDVATAARGAFERAKVREQQAEAAARERAQEAKAAAKKEASKAEQTAKEKAAEAKGLIASALEMGKDKALEIVEQARSVVGMAAEKVDKAPASPTLNPVQKALEERFEKPEAKHNRTVAEALKERYTPMDQRDNTVLRGV